MGNISMTVGSLQDLVTEEVGCKSGLLLTTSQAGELLERRKHSDADVFSRSYDSWIRMRPEDIDDVINELRYAVGDLADLRHPIAKRVIWVRELEAKGIDPCPIYEAFKTVVSSKKYKVIGQEAAEEMAALSGLPLLLNTQFLSTVAEQLDRQVNWFSVRDEPVEWAIPLDSLFKTESIPADPDTYLDQRYIDYFVRNGEDLQRMHWRNFERLTAEFFKRRGYEVELGKGSKDGGVDLRIWPSAAQKVGPPLLLVQCKRYKKGRDVCINSVKAFWTDVNYEDAQHGIIATTSRVSPEGINVSRARKWPLGFVQQQQVSHWVRTMWRHAPFIGNGNE